jgi:ribonuclease R
VKPRQQPVAKTPAPRYVAAAPAPQNSQRAQNSRNSQTSENAQNPQRRDDARREPGDARAVPAPSPQPVIEGLLRFTRQGRCFVRPDDAALPSITIVNGGSGAALDEDRVAIRLAATPRGVREASPAQAFGVVVSVLERRRTRVVGTLETRRDGRYVTPEGARGPHAIRVLGEDPRGRAPRGGDLVVVVLEALAPRGDELAGRIVEVLGRREAPGVDDLVVRRSFDLPAAFPPEVEAAAAVFGTRVEAADLVAREDRRSDLVVTIDPPDARDLDDAICLLATKHGFRLTVHVADVSHYVAPGSALDCEALLRGNSTYLVGAVVPMLPEALSNGLCSLHPDVDRLTSAVEFELDREGNVLAARTFKAVIRSQRRYSYGEAMAVLARKPAGRIEEMLHAANRLAQAIRKRRMAAGALPLELPEIKIALDAEGYVNGVAEVEHDASHELIEEFMLLANEAVAQKLEAMGRAAVHRVHDSPERSRLDDLRREVGAFGLECDDLNDRAAIASLLHRTAGAAVGHLVRLSLLRSLPPARYAVDSLGHYGLAKSAYTHFTSPIRRYADLLVHRALFDVTPPSRESLAAAADAVSRTERNSTSAERESRAAKVFAYLEKELASGKVAPRRGVVVEVRTNGVFVDVPLLGIRGRIAATRDDSSLMLTAPTAATTSSLGFERTVRPGAEVTVEIIAVDRDARHVEFRLAVARHAPARRKAAAASRSLDGHAHQPRSGNLSESERRHDRRA